MEAYIWLILASMFGVGILFGLFFGRGKEVHPTAQIKELEESLGQAKQEMEDYRGEVTEHFGKTAELFNQLTNDYREVYEHLATSSEKLCGDQVEKLKALSSDSVEKPLIESEEVSHEVQAEESANQAEEVAEPTEAEKEEPTESKAEALTDKSVKPETDLEKKSVADPSNTPAAVADTAAAKEAKLDEKASDARIIH